MFFLQFDLLLLFLFLFTVIISISIIDIRLMKNYVSVLKRWLFPRIALLSAKGVGSLTNILFLNVGKRIGVLNTNLLKGESIYITTIFSRQQQQLTWSQWHCMTLTDLKVVSLTSK